MKVILAFFAVPCMIVGINRVIGVSVLYMWFRSVEDSLLHRKTESGRDDSTKDFP